MSVGDAADPTEAVAAFLRTEMGTVVEGKVFRPELPQSIDPTLPTDAIVVMPAGRGGLTAGTRWAMIDSNVDVLCYGGSRLQADNIARQASNLLDLLKTVSVVCPEVGGKILISWARMASGVVPRVEGPADWPFAEFTAQCMHSRLVLP